MLKQNRLQMNSYYKSTKINFMKQNLLKLTACISLLVIANTIHAQTWSLTGNTGTSDGTNFIGTTDNVPLNFRVNNQKAGRIDATMQNAFYGLQAGGSNTTGNYNTSIGNYSLFSNTTGIYNMANGFSALFSNTTGSFNMANGAQALRHNTTGSFNMAIGYASLYYNTTGSYNISSGYTALFNNTTGVFNMGNGYAALYANTSGSYNTADGSYALRFNTIGGYNTASGYAALYNTTTGSNNLANGYNALYSNTTGNQSTAIGYQSLFNSTGSNHTAIGYNSLYSNTTGTSNTAIGLNALYTNTTGSNNTSLGYGADVAIGGLTNATAIGSGAIASTSNIIQLGNAAVTQVMAGTGSNAILIAGGLKITGGTLGVGKVLTSDNNGVATWQAPTGGGGSGWSLTGNSGTVDGTNFIGTIDNVPLNFRVNNKLAAKIDSTRNFSVGDNSGLLPDYSSLYPLGKFTSSYNQTNSKLSAYAGIVSDAHMKRDGSGFFEDFGNISRQYEILPNGITNSGQVTGYYAESFRNYDENGTGHHTTSDNGTLSGLYGERLLFGHYNTDLSALPITSNVYGIFLYPYAQTGTITNMYDLYLYSKNGSATITNHWGIYQVDASIKNYLGGKTGVGVTSPDSTFQVNGGLKFVTGRQGAGKVLTSDANGGADWQNPASSSWSLNGNSGTIDGTNFIGTTDNVPFNIRVNNTPSGRIDPGLLNTFYGYLSGASNTTGYGNTANGSYALLSNTTGYGNTANGNYALISNNVGIGNTANGYNALYTNSTGSFNTANGYFALYSNTYGGGNTANGYEVLYSNTNGGGNTANGYGALYTNTSGGGNSAYGVNALIMNNTGNYNTANGYFALYSNNSGGGNTAYGASALTSNSTGSNLTAVGFLATVNADGYTNSTALGYDAIITGSNQVVLGNSSIANIYAQVTGITALSDNRFKKNIKEDVPGLEFIKLLRPVTYNYDIKGVNTHIRGSIPAASQLPGADSAMGKALPKMHTLQPSKEDEAGIAQKEKIQYTGLVAQEVETAANKVGYDFSGLHKPQNDKDTYGLNYTDFVAPLIKSVQELSSSNDKLQKQNNDLENRLNQLEIKLESLVKGGISSGSTILSSGKLEQNVPNPFNQTTLINYYVPETAGHAFIKVAGMNGNDIKTIQLNNIGSGQITLQTATLASGNYTYSLYVDGNLIDTKVMVLAR